MTEDTGSAVLFFGEGPLRRMLTVLCRRSPGKAVLADGDDEQQRTKATAFARENGLPLVLITVHPDCPLPEGIRAVRLERPFLFRNLQQLLEKKDTTRTPQGDSICTSGAVFVTSHGRSTLEMWNSLVHRGPGRGEALRPSPVAVPGQSLLPRSPCPVALLRSSSLHSHRTRWPECPSRILCRK